MKRSCKGVKEGGRREKGLSGLGIGGKTSSDIAHLSEKKKKMDKKEVKVQRTYIAYN